MNYYFTYGASPSYPFIGGWTKVVAPDKTRACAMFRSVHPDKNEGILNCADVYTEDEFCRTGLNQTGNRGHFCHELLLLYRAEDTPNNGTEGEQT